jgi:uncharacterized repeat protein (TIGR01451 family)
VGSADYNTYCQSVTAPSAPAATTAPSAIAKLSTSFFVKPTAAQNQWQKSAEAGSNGTVYFEISVTNLSTVQADNVSVSANIPNQMSSLGNLQINSALVSGDIVSGINIGSVAASATKLITFEGKTQTISTTATQQATATSNVSGVAQTDSVSINFVQAQAVAAAVVASTAPASTGFLAFLKQWYVWILVGVVLVFLFVIVFRRLSSNA